MNCIDSFKNKILNKKINRIRNELIFFDVINLDKRLTKLISKLKDDKNFPAKENLTILQLEIESHNETVTSLSKQFDSIIRNYPIKLLINNINDFDYEKINAILIIADEISKFQFKEINEKNKTYKRYCDDIKDIGHNYSYIKEQFDTLNKIDESIKALPDLYIDYQYGMHIIDALSSKLSVLKNSNKCYYSMPVIDFKLIENHNKAFIERHINDSIFDNINNRSLDEDQRRSILCDSKSNLTIAGAGAGKTLTICGKVKYLLDNNLAEENDILLLSYSRASADDLEKKMLGISDKIKVETFHSLGMQILTEHYGTKKAVEEQLKAYIQKFFDEEMPKDSLLCNELFVFLTQYFYEPKKYKNYKTTGDLYEDLKQMDYRTLKDRLKALSQNQERHETLKNELVKSNEELIIANFLFTNGIRYEYERPYEYETSTIEKRQYVPDFYLSDYNIYLEHYGIDKYGKTPQYSENESQNYIKSMQWKRALHKEKGTICLETYSYEFEDGTIFDNLKKRLKENGVNFNPLSQTEIMDVLNNIYLGKDFSSLFNLISTFISLYKSQIKDESGFEDLKLKLLKTQYETNRANLFLNICRSIYRYYMLNLREENKIDFDDMILQSIDILDNTENFKYKYIIVDEFQDISQSRNKLLQKLIKHGESKLFAVGDDWQSIYRFTGSDINIFLNFEKNYSDPKINYITSTHRNSAELQSIVEPFITANPSQYKKHIKSNIHQDNPVRIIYHSGNKPMALTNALDDIKKINPRAKVLILGRNKRDIDAFVCKDIQIKAYSEIVHKDFQQMKLEYRTIHSSKGLESDFVILISGENAQNGFPNKIEDDSILNLILGEENSFEYAEERRLFYVALTRTRSIIYILSNKNTKSDFVQEIESLCSITNDDSEQKVDEIFCPWCKSGKLVIRMNENDKTNFYGCTNYPYCKYTNSNIKSVYFNKRCPECGDFIEYKIGQYGAFWGCHNYPRCKYTKKYGNDI